MDRATFSTLAISSGKGEKIKGRVKQAVGTLTSNKKTEADQEFDQQKVEMLK